jgi:hypothetical protein
MNNNSSIDIFNKKLVATVLVMEKEEQRPLITILSRKQHWEAVNRIQALVMDLKRYAKQTGLSAKMKGVIEALEKRHQQLAKTPPWTVVSMAQSILQFPNLCVLEYDAVFNVHTMRPQLQQLVAVDRNAHVLFHHTLDGEPSRIASTVANLGTVIEGKYILAYDLMITQLLLDEMADRSSVEMPTLIGQSLADLSHLCLGLSPISLSAGTKVGDMQGHATFYEDAIMRSLERSPETALDRAVGMLRMLQAMAQGFSEIPSACPPVQAENMPASESSERKDEHDATEQ